MRRYLTALLALYLITALAGCTTQQQATTSPSAEATASSAETVQDCLGDPRFDTWDAYEKYVMSFTDQSDFIAYDTIKELGSFCRFVDSSYSMGKLVYPDKNGKRNGKCTSYSYALDTEYGQRILFVVTHDAPIEVMDTSTVAAFTGTPELQKSEGTLGWRAIGGILYYYDQEGLRTIQWSTEGDLYSISILKGSFSDYPVTDAPLSRFLNADTAAVAVAEFNAIIAEARQQAETKANK